MVMELEHTADVGFRVNSRSLNNLFEDAALALMKFVCDPHQILRKDSRKITLSAATREDLMFSWLSELVYLFDGEHLLLGEFVVEVFSAESGGFQLNAIISGESFDRSRHEILTYVKGITLHQLKVAEVEDGWVAEVYLDV